jgi:GT2 family glycosyltransferase
MLDCSIIIINYNTQSLTSACIKSIYEKTENINYEVILVDNASDECNPDLFLKEFPQIKLIKNKMNIGFAKGINSGIEHANGKYILLLNSDTQLKNNAIKLGVEIMEKDHSIGVLSSKLEYPNGALQYPAERFPSLKTELKELFRLNKKLTPERKSHLYLGPAFDHLTKYEADWIWGTFFMFRKSILEKLGEKLPDKYFMYAEDIDWCWNIKKLGFKILYYPDAEIIHYGGASMSIDSEIDKFFTYMMPNKFDVIATHKGFCYAWVLYFIKAIHLITLKNRQDFKKSKKYLKFLFGKKNYWFNK